MEQIPTHVQVLANIRQTPVKYKIIIITKVYFKIILILAYILYYYKLKSLGLDNRTTLVLSNIRELDRNLSTN